MPSKTIKVFVVDDSSLFRKMIIDYLSSCPDIQVVGYAFNAYDARKKIPVLKPDVITMDVEMPGLNGIDFLKDFLPLHPIPVVLVSSLNPVSYTHLLFIYQVIFCTCHVVDRFPESAFECFRATLTADLSAICRDTFDAALHRFYLDWLYK